MKKGEILYRGSVKNIWSVSSENDSSSVLFEYTDAFSVFDWGKMPDSLTGKGEALCTLAASLFQSLEQAETWKEFSKSQAALRLRRGSRFGSEFNEWGERLQQEGLRTHFLAKTSKIEMAVKRVSAVRPESNLVLGQSVYDYSGTRASSFPRLIPLEVVFRFGVPEGSSLIERVKQNPDYLRERGFGDARWALKPESSKIDWDFPVLELFTKLESTDRAVTLSEALAISGLTSAQLQTMLFQTAWVAGWLRARAEKTGIVLADGKLEWAIGAAGEILLVDAIGPDELRLVKNGVSLSKEFLRAFYRGTPWYEEVQKAKQGGATDWKRKVSLPAPQLSSEVKLLAVKMYQALTNALSGHEFFSEAGDLDAVVAQVRNLRENAHASVQHLGGSHT